MGVNRGGFIMSKGLEALKDIKQLATTIEFDYKKDKVFVKEELDIIEKELKALEIIKNKKVDVSFLELGLEQYNTNLRKKHQLTQEEYDLLKEVLL